MAEATTLDAAVQGVKRGVSELIGPLIKDHDVVLTGNAATSAALASIFKELGAKSAHSIQLPVDDSTPLHVRQARMEQLLADPPESARDVLHQIDPASAALVYAGSFTAQPTFCGREIIGSRKKSQLEAERKDRQVHYIHGDIDSRRLILDLTDERIALRVVRDHVRQGPVVISGIPLDYVATGSSHTFLLQDTDDDVVGSIAAAVHSLAADCANAVLSDFDSGIPCTFYGFYSRKWVIDFGPFEALVYWNRGTSRLSAPGIVRPLTLGSSLFRAAQAEVRAVLNRLHAETGYTGAFCTDGVLKTDGYAIHEVNPRVCAGFSLLGELCGGRMPLSLVDLALRMRPAEATDRLANPLVALAAHLEVQNPLVRLWDTQFAPLQDELRRRIREVKDPSVWVAQVRQALASADSRPVVTGSPEECIWRR